MEEYTGVKFRTVFNGSSIPADRGLANLKRWCAMFQSRALAPTHTGGSYGNLSYRPAGTENVFIITATGISLRSNLNNEDFVTVHGCDHAKETVYACGAHEPSSETFMHFNIYQLRKDVMAVFHGHSKDILDAQHYLGIPVTPTVEAYGTAALAAQVKVLAGEHDFFILRNHGFVSLGATMHQAGQAALDMLARAGSPYFKKMMKK